MKVLEVKNLEKSFRKKKIIKNISFDIEEGEIVGFVGPNGAGKTTTLKLLTSLIYPDKGEIIINGYNLFKNREQALSYIAAIIENPGLYKNLSGKNNMDFIRKLRGISKDKMKSAIEYTGLENRIDDKVRKYSLGMKQRLALGMCVLCEPKLLVLDEPTNGLDPTGTMEFRNLIISLAKTKGMSIIFSSHLLSEVEKICDKIIFLKDGQIISIKDNKEKKQMHLYKLCVKDSPKVKDILNNFDMIYNILVLSENEILINIKENSIGEVLNLLVENNISFSDIEKKESDIEDEYNKLFKENS